MARGVKEVELVTGQHLTSRNTKNLKAVNAWSVNAPFSSSYSTTMHLPYLQAVGDVEEGGEAPALGWPGARKVLVTLATIIRGITREGRVGPGGQFCIT